MPHKSSASIKTFRQARRGSLVPVEAAGDGIFRTLLVDNRHIKRRDGLVVNWCYSIRRRHIYTNKESSFLFPGNRERVATPVFSAFESALRMKGRNAAAMAVVVEQEIQNLIP